MTNCIHDHSRWGNGDQLGAGHLLTPEVTLAALSQVTEGRIYDMSHIIEMGAPRITTTLKFGTRTDREQTVDDKVQSVEEKLA